MASGSKAGNAKTILGLDFVEAQFEIASTWLCWPPISSHTLDSSNCKGYVSLSSKSFSCVSTGTNAITHPTFANLLNSFVNNVLNPAGLPRVESSIMRCAGLFRRKISTNFLRTTRVAVQQAHPANVSTDKPSSSSGSALPKSFTSQAQRSSGWRFLTSALIRVVFPAPTGPVTTNTRVISGDGKAMLVPSSMKAKAQLDVIAPLFCQR
mmetsp:Transcript_78911/g.124587  ORF Transcript_78911/g.124587 Transcript_78911/m.124587 type:complete len:209 (-) Transcript_78911:56-682(-)